jgi:hypothetical protein
LQRLKAMRATCRNVQRRFAMRIEPERLPVQITWRIRTQIGDHIIDSTTNTVNKLRFAVRRVLEVHPSQCTSLPRDREALLYELRLKAGGGEFLAAEQAGERATVVLMALQPHRD